MGARKVKRVITQKENGREVELMAGETFQVSLPENPTTGYRWTVYGSSATLVGLEKEEYDAPGEDPARPMLGRGGTRVLTFKAAEPGAVELVLRLRRSWEKESEFAASFSVKLKILERPALR
jgi:inhibitor of cysteine peptidase